MLKITKEELKQLETNAKALSYQLGLDDSWFPTREELETKLSLDKLSTQDVMFLFWCQNTFEKNLTEDEEDAKEFIEDILHNGNYICITDEIKKKDSYESKRKEQFSDIFKKYGY